MTDTSTSSGSPSGIDFDDHRIEQNLLVYTQFGSDGWRVDLTTADGYPLNTTTSGTTNGECECGRPDECEQAREHAANVPAPTAAALLPLLVQAVVELFDAKGAHNDAMPHLATESRVWAELRTALREDDCDLSRRTLMMLFGE